jgi:hypothetical protein
VNKEIKIVITAKIESNMEVLQMGADWEITSDGK